MLAALIVALTLAACSGQAAESATIPSSSGLIGTSTANTATTTTDSRPSTTSTTTTAVPSITTIAPLAWDLMGGVGFWLGSTDQRALLSVVPIGAVEYDFEGQWLPAEFGVPDEKWQAELALGTNLLTRWDYRSQPTPVVLEQWPIVAGTITILELPPAGECGEARAYLEGLEAQRPDGTRMQLGDFEVRNHAWGCLRT